DIGAHVRGAALRSERADVDDLAAAALEHGRHRGARGVEDAAGVHTEEEVPVLVLRLVHRRAHAEAAGDVAQDVDAAEALERFSDGRAHALSVEQVHFQKHLVGAVLQVASPQVEKRQRGAELGERAGHGTPEISGRASNDDGTVSERHLHPLSLWYAASMTRARSRSFCVTPPASWVLSVTRTLL